MTKSKDSKDSKDNMPRFIAKTATGITATVTATLSTVPTVKPSSLASLAAKVLAASNQGNPVPVKKTVATKKSSSCSSPSKYSKMGQKYDSPVQTDPLCRFYMSTLKQKPDSRMALKWCLERGLLTPKKTTEALLVLELSGKLNVK